MGIIEAFKAEDRTEMKVSTLYQMLREAAKCELLMNAVNCDVPHRYIRDMATGNSKEPDPMVEEEETEVSVEEETEVSVEEETEVSV